MSPEQATSERAIDRRSDIYSLGCVLYEMLAGHPPFIGATVQALLAQIVVERPRRVSLLRDTVPAHVEAALTTALAKLPADRFATAAQFADALTKPGPLALPETAARVPQELGHPCDERRQAWHFHAASLAVGLVLGGVAVAVTAALASRGDTPAASISPVTRFPIDVGELAPGPSIAVSADGSQIVYAALDSQRVTRLFRRSLDHTEAVAIPGTAGASKPFFSLDGQTIGFFQDNRIKRTPLGGGEISIVCQASPSPGGASWGPGDVIVFSAPWSGRNSLFRVTAAGGEPELLATPDTLDPGPFDIQHFEEPNILPDGRTVLFTAWGTVHATLAAISLDDPRVVDLSQLGQAPQYVDGRYVVFFDGAFKVRPLDARRVRFSGPSRSFAAGARSQIVDDWANLAVSRTGTAAFLVGASPPRDLVLFDRQGRTETVPVRPNYYFYPRFSPDGRRIAVNVQYPFNNAWDIFSFDRDVGRLERLTVDSASPYPEWAPSGSRIIHAGPGAIAGDWDFRWIPAGGGPSQLLLARPGDQWEGLLTPDGRSLVFFEFANQRTGGDIWLMPVDTPQAARPIARSEGFERSPALSHDGRWLAYQSNLTGVVEVFVQPLEGPFGPRQVSQGGGQAPRWGPDGRELFYVWGDSLYAVPITPGAELGIGRARALFGAPRLSAFRFDVHPDGEHFLFVRPHPDDRSRIEVLTNWFEALRAGG